MNLIPLEVTSVSLCKNQDSCMRTLKESFHLSKDAVKVRLQVLRPGRPTVTAPMVAFHPMNTLIYLVIKRRK